MYPLWNYPLWSIVTFEPWRRKWVMPYNEVELFVDEEGEKTS